MAPSIYPELRDLYDVHETIGSGGFAKVKLGTHLLTGEKVAIKIMAKRSLGDDLPRVKREIDALKTLCHQNICKLYQIIESEERYFLIVEYCAGGELFDYIVKKDRLPEPEARHFFRQIVSAIAYVHDKGYVHRDLKPENLLLTENLQIKLIDFGLCAQFQNGITDLLETCCGSPAYAAPELIAGTPYCGNEVDVWSIGVLLYALLCGFLPFEDSNLQTMYKKIQLGRYREPPWLSDSSKSLLKAMLNTNPRKRITVKQLLIHPWVIGDYSQPIKWRSVYEKNAIDYDCSEELAFYESMKPEEMICELKKWKYDYRTATYVILQGRKQSRRPFVLPPNSKAKLDVNSKMHMIIRSPTIHASLESGIDSPPYDDGPDSGLDFDSDYDEVPVRSRLNKDSSYRTAVSHGWISTESVTPVSERVRSHLTQMDGSDPLATPKTNANPAQQTPAVKSLGQSRPQYRSVYCNTSGSQIFCPLNELQNDVGRLADTPFSKKLRIVAATSPKKRMVAIATPRNGTPSRKRTPKITRRMFNSVERHVDRMINLITPRRRRLNFPMAVRKTRALGNVSTTYNKSPEQVINQLVKVFESKGINCKQKGWTLRGKATDGNGHTYLTLEFEIVYIDNLNMVGVRRKRLNGDSFMYKRVCEDVLNLASL